MKLGIIGPPQSGKSVLYGALTGTDTSQIFEKKVFFHTVDVHDERIPPLARIYNTEKLIHNKLVFYDFPGYDISDSELKSMDGYLVVLGDHANVAEDIQAQLDSIFGDFYLNDLTIVQKRFDVITKGKKQSDWSVEAKILTELLELLQEEKNVYGVFTDPEKLKFLKGFQLFTMKPVFVVLNSDESPRKELNKNYGFPIVSVNGKNELEISLLKEDEREEFLEMMEIEEPIINKFTATLYEFLQLLTFFSCSDMEIRAWPLRKGGTAHEAAGAIHTDIMKGFIKAEIVNAREVIEAGSEKAAKEAALYHLEGKEYPIKDGDIINIRFQKK